MCNIYTYIYIYIYIYIYSVYLVEICYPLYLIKASQSTIYFHVHSIMFSISAEFGKTSDITWVHYDYIYTLLDIMIHRQIKTQYLMILLIMLAYHHGTGYEHLNSHRCIQHKLTYKMVLKSNLVIQPYSHR